MYRFVLTATLLTAVGMLLAGDALAQTDELELPPVKLKPDRPSKAKPIPPTPDEREVQPPEEPAPPPEPPPAPKEAEPEEPKAPAPPPEPVLPDEEPAPKPPAKVEPKPVPLRPEKPAAGQPPTPADLPMPKPVMEPPEAAPEKVAVPESETPPVVMPPPVETPAPKPTDIQERAIEAQVTPTVQPDLSGMGEVGLVEAVAMARKHYERALEALRTYYQNRGDSTKIEWVQSEIQGFAAIPKVRYLIAAELAGPNLKPIQNIDAANQLYQEALDFKNYPAFPPGKKDYLKTALEKFRTIIEKYPQSDKIDDAAFRMGEIYGGWYFQDYARAVQSYERCWQWNPNTEYPARFNAAKIFEEKLKNRAKAVELYNEVIAHSQNEDVVRQAQERIRALTGR